MTRVYSQWFSNVYNILSTSSTAAPGDATYIISQPNAFLGNAQVLSGLVSGFAKISSGTGTFSTQSQILSTDLANTAVTAASYTVNGQALFTVNAKGQLTAASNVTITNITGNAGTVTTNANLTGVVTSTGNATIFASMTSNYVLLGNGTATPQQVAPGTSGNVLTSNGTTWSSQAPSVATLPTGTMFNFQQGVLTSSATITGGFADTGLSVSITPTSSSNKVLVRAVIQVGSPATDFVFAQMLRGSTAIGIGDAAGTRTRVGGAAFESSTNCTNTIVMEWLDTPATTSATTYKVQIAASGGVNSVTINQSTTDTNSSVVPRTASTISVCEIKS